MFVNTATEISCTVAHKINISETNPNNNNNSVKNKITFYDRYHEKLKPLFAGMLKFHKFNLYVM